MFIMIIIIISSSSSSSNNMSIMIAEEVGDGHAVEEEKHSVRLRQASTETRSDNTAKQTDTCQNILRRI